MSIFDSDEVTFGPFGSKVWDLYAKLREVCDVEMMNFTEEELHMINLLYGENFSYPVHNHVTSLLTGAPQDEVIH
jgi:hypothetical protein